MPELRTLTLLADARIWRQRTLAFAALSTKVAGNCRPSTLQHLFRRHDTYLVIPVEPCGPTDAIWLHAYLSNCLSHCFLDSNRFSLQQRKQYRWDYRIPGAVWSLFAATIPIHSLLGRLVLLVFYIRDSGIVQYALERRLAERELMAPGGGGYFVASAVNAILYCSCKQRRHRLDTDVRSRLLNYEPSPTRSDLQAIPLSKRPTTSRAVQPPSMSENIPGAVGFRLCT